MSVQESPPRAGPGPKHVEDDLSVSTPDRPVLVWMALVALVASAVVGSNVGGVRDALFGTVTARPAPPAASRVAGEASTGQPAVLTALRSQPWWQEVATPAGTGLGAAGPVTISEEAIQWRIEATCDGSFLRVRVAGDDEAVVDGPCGDGLVGYATETGEAAVEVETDGDWQLQIDQQIDNPLSEPPTAAMSDPGSSVVASGEFYDIDNTGIGTVDLYRLADGGYALRLEDFFVTPNVDLEIRLSTLDAPQTSEEFQESPNELVRLMDVTAGSLNYAIPAGIDPTQFGSVVIWCVPIDSAYAAATLEEQQ